MKRTIAGITLVLLVGTAAYASSVHLKPPKSSPTFNDQGLVLQAMGALAGLGQEDVVIFLTATADVTAVCVNGGQHAAPGQNPAPITVTGSEAIPASQIKNGNVAFDVTTKAPTTPIAGAPDCPNPNWTENITDLAFTSATIKVEQPAPTVVLTVMCSFAPPTANGVVPTGDVACMSL